MLDPKFLGIDYTDVPAGLLQGCRYTPAQLLERGPQPGWYAVNVDGFRRKAADLSYFFCFKPVARAGYSIYIYHVSTENADRVRRQLGLPELAAIRGLSPSHDGRKTPPSPTPVMAREP